MSVTVCYLYSVLIFMIIDFGIVNMHKEVIMYRVNRIMYITGQETDDDGSVMHLFIVFAVPVVRLLVTVSFIFLATCSDETFDVFIDMLRDEMRKQ